MQSVRPIFFVHFGIYLEIVMKANMAIKHYSLIFVLTIVAGLLAGCGNSGLLTPTAMNAATALPTLLPTSTSTSVPPSTATATSTNTPTATVLPTSTPMPSPTATATPVSTATPKNTAAPKPTKIAPTATATATLAIASSSVEVPPPQLFQFDAGGFIKYLDYAHLKYQLYLQGHGGVSKGDYIGSCVWFNQIRGEILGVVAFTNAPPEWQAMVNEYNSLREQAIIAIEPVNAVCARGGGTISAEADHQILALFDHAQNRMYQMLQQAKAMIK